MVITLLINRYPIMMILALTRLPNHDELPNNNHDFDQSTPSSHTYVRSQVFRGSMRNIYTNYTTDQHR
jgi:hypothetical protein